MTMTMKPLLLIVCLVIAPKVVSQTESTPKREVAAEFVALPGDRTEVGFGARFTHNLNDNFALEAAAFFFPCPNCFGRGRITEAVGGLKAGKRFKTWGIFAKARPGVVSFSRGRIDVVQTGAPLEFPFAFEFRSLTHFATDLGGVLEFYPSRRIVTRFDAGNTMIFIRQSTQNAFQFDPATNTFTLLPLRLQGRTSHNFQFSAGVGFRW